MEALRVIARIRSQFPSRFGIPRQGNIIKKLKAAVIFEPEYRSPDAVRGLEDFSHIWLIWGFSEAERDVWSPTVRPPRLGGNARVGVFATRSPYRPNPLGMSSVVLERIELHPDLGPVIHVSGADMMDGTPIYDIKPYIPYTDSHSDAKGGFADAPPSLSLTVRIDGKQLEALPEETAGSIRDILALDPRPSYHDDPARVYGMEYDGFEIKFSVNGDILTVHKIAAIEQ